VQRPLLGCDLPQTVQSEVDTFADADAGSAGEQERIRRQVIGAA